MFDAKSILESIVRGAASQGQGQSGAGGGLGGLGDILGQVMKGGQAGGAAGGGGLGDILGELQRRMGQTGSGQAGSGQSGGGAGAGPNQGPAHGAGSSGLPGGMGDILGQLKEQLGKAGGAMAGGQGAGGIGDMLGQVFKQATEGAKEGATRIGSATGAGDALGKAMGGLSTEELLEKVKGFMRDNPMAAAGAAAGAGGVLLGTRAGRAVAGSAARIGALALIGGLAYKAFQNYQAGKPLVTGATAAEAAPTGSGFEPGAVTNDSATLYIRAMIAAAAADGRVDAAEQAKIVGSLKQAGVDQEAEAFLANELNNPASVEELAGAVSSPEEAVQVYTAARIAIEPDAAAEKRFLSALAGALGIDAKLAAHIDAQTRSAAA